MFLRVQISLCSSVLLLCASADPASAQQLCGRKFSSSTQMLAEVSRDSNARRLSGNLNLVVLSDEKAMTIWTFAMEGHPAYPAVICRRPREVGGQVQVELQARCAGPKAACNALVADFQKQNAPVRNTLHQRLNAR